MTKLFRTTAEARSYLDERYEEQSLLFPLLRSAVGKKLYVSANLRNAMKLTDPSEDES